MRHGGGSPAPIFSVYPDQINFQIPDGLSGDAGVIVSNKCGTPQQEDSAQQASTIQAASPEFFYFLQNTDGHDPIAAINAVTGAYIGAPGSISWAHDGCGQVERLPDAFRHRVWSNEAVLRGRRVPNASAQVTGAITVMVGGITLDAAQILYAGVTADADYN